MADEKANDEAFGRPVAGRNSSASPQIRLVSRVKSGAPVLFGARRAEYATGEVTLGQPVIPSLRQGMLCLADRNFFGFWPRSILSGEMARVLAHRKNKLTYWLVFFDGEEALKQWSPSDSLYGSRHLAEKLAGDGTLKRVKALILVDMVADRHLNILRESNSTPWLSDLVFNTATQMDHGRSFSGATFPVEDDHVPFMRKGVPAVDIIDLTPFTSYHHTALDNLDKCSPESLSVIGRVVMVTLAQLENATRHCHLVLSGRSRNGLQG